MFSLKVVCRMTGSHLKAGPALAHAGTGIAVAAQRDGKIRGNILTGIACLQHRITFPFIMLIIAQVA